MKQPSRHLLAIVAAATFVHTALLIVVRARTGAVDTYAFQSIDAREYHTIAANLVDHAAFSQNPAPPLRPDTWRTPGYPFFLAGLMLIVGKSPAALLVAQQLLGVLSAALLFAIAARHISPRRATVVTLLFLLEPYHVYYSLWLMSTTLQTTLILAIWLALDRGAKPLWAGLLCAALVLTWPGALFVPIAAFAFLMTRAWHQHRTQSHDVWAIPVKFVWICGIATSTWMFRNAVVAGAFALSDQSGIVLAYFKATEVVLWSEGRTADRYLETSLDSRQLDHSHRVWDSIDLRLFDHHYDKPEVNWRNLAQGNRTDADSFVLSSELALIAVEMMLDLPLSTLGCGLTRIAQILTFPLDLGLAPPNGVTINRARSALVGGVYTLLAGWVMFRLIRHRSALVSAGFPLLCTLALLLAATPQTDPRFRVPMIPMLLLLAFVPTRRATNFHPAENLSS